MNGFIPKICWLATRGTIWLQGDEVVYEGDFSPSFKQQLSEHREDIELMFKLDQLAKRSGWFQLEWGSMYEMQVSKTSYVYLEREDNGWTVWRGSWMQSKHNTAIRPIRVKIVGSRMKFEEALAKGNNYVKWWRR